MVLLTVKDVEDVDSVCWAGDLVSLESAAFDPPVCAFNAGATFETALLSLELVTLVRFGISCGISVSLGGACRFLLFDDVSGPLYTGPSGYFSGCVSLASGSRPIGTLELGSGIGKWCTWCGLRE